MAWYENFEKKTWIFLIGEKSNKELMQRYSASQNRKNEMFLFCNRTYFDILNRKEISLCCVMTGDHSQTVLTELEKREKLPPGTLEVVTESIYYDHYLLINTLFRLGKKLGELFLIRKQVLVDLIIELQCKNDSMEEYLHNKETYLRIEKLLSIYRGEKETPSNNTSLTLEGIVEYNPRLQYFTVDDLNENKNFENFTFPNDKIGHFLREYGCYHRDILRVLGSSFFLVNYKNGWVCLCKMEEGKIIIYGQMCPFRTVWSRKYGPCDRGESHTDAGALLDIYPCDTEFVEKLSKTHPIELGDFLQLPEASSIRDCFDKIAMKRSQNGLSEHKLLYKSNLGEIYEKKSFDEPARIYKQGFLIGTIKNYMFHYNLNMIEHNVILMYYLDDKDREYFRGGDVISLLREGAKNNPLIRMKLEKQYELYGKEEDSNYECYFRGVAKFLEKSD
jgi:hypothetical protein